jgi:hypothetical protein
MAGSMYKLRTLLTCVALFIVQTQVVCQAASLSDPTRPYDYVPADTRTEEPVVLPREQVQWDLSAIRIGKDSRFAIINGQLVRPGEQIESAKLLEIKPSEVVLEYDNRSVIVTLLDRAVKKTAR